MIDQADVIAELERDAADAEAALERALHMPGTDPERVAERRERIARARWWVDRTREALREEQANQPQQREVE